MLQHIRQQRVQAERHHVGQLVHNPVADDALGGRAHDPGEDMAQFVEIKTANPDCLLFYRMGDFYELFFEDAEIASRTLGIVLTKRGKHLGEDIPMCGVPVHAADAYLQKLIRMGHRVAVCEQMEDPAEARKRGSKAVVKRDVVRLVTPGTLTEDNLLDSRSHNFLASVTRNKATDELAIAWADISSGELAVMQTSATRLSADLTRLDLRTTDSMSVSAVQFRMTLPSSATFLRADALAAGSNRASKAIADLPPRQSSGFDVSDLLIARELRTSSPAPNRWSDFAITPLVGGAITSGQPIDVLWEIYGLSESAGQARYRISLVVEQLAKNGAVAVAVRALSGLRNAVTGTESARTIRVSFAREAEYRPTVVEQLKIGLGDLAPGNYRMRIEITELPAGLAELKEKKIRDLRLLPNPIADKKVLKVLNKDRVTEVVKELWKLLEKSGGGGGGKKGGRR